MNILLNMCHLSAYNFFPFGLNIFGTIYFIEKLATLVGKKVLYMTDYWPIMLGIHLCPADFFHKGPVIWNFDVFVIALYKSLYKQSSGQ